MAAALHYASRLSEEAGKARAALGRRVAGLVLLAGAVVPLSIAWAWQDLGPAPFVAACLSGWLLVGLSLVDARLMILPNGPVLALGGAALSFWALSAPEALPDALAGAALGYGVLRGLDLAYRSWRGCAGLGGGDPRLMAACGALLGWAGVPAALVGASLIGLGAVALRRAAGLPGGWRDGSRSAPASQREPGSYGQDRRFPEPAGRRHATTRAARRWRRHMMEEPLDRPH